MYTHVHPSCVWHAHTQVLGIADPASVLKGVPLGVDTFDSCFPTRVGRHGTLLTRDGPLNLKSASYRRDFGPVDPRMPHTLPGEVSRAYLHHLFRMKEPLYATLASMHNVAHMTTLMAELRQAILADEL